MTPKKKGNPSRFKRVLRWDLRIKAIVVASGQLALEGRLEALIPTGDQGAARSKGVHQVAGTLSLLPTEIVLDLSIGQVRLGGKLEARGLGAECIQSLVTELEFRSSFYWRIIEHGQAEVEGTVRRPACPDCAPATLGGFVALLEGRNLLRIEEIGIEDLLSRIYLKGDLEISGLSLASIFFLKGDRIPAEG